jgi:hypothetical protein
MISPSEARPIPIVEFDHTRQPKTGKQKGRHTAAALFNKI